MRKPSEEDDADRQPRRRDEQRAAAARGSVSGARPQPDPQHARQQVDQQRVDERDGDVDLRVVEERQRDAEGQRARAGRGAAAAAGGASRRTAATNSTAQRDPHPRRVDLAPERARRSRAPSSTRPCSPSTPRCTLRRSRRRSMTCAISFGGLACAVVVGDLPAVRALQEDARIGAGVLAALGDDERAARSAIAWTWRRSGACPGGATSRSALVASLFGSTGAAARLDLDPALGGRASRRRLRARRRRHRRPAGGRPARRAAPRGRSHRAEAPELVAEEVQRRRGARSRSPAPGTSGSPARDEQLEEEQRG